MAKFTRQPRRNESKIAGMYDLEERLGSGHFAEVKLARHVFTGERVAVKVIDKLKLDETAKHHLYQEVRCMKLVQHPNIVRLYEVIDTNTKLYLVQELGDGGDMYDYIMKHESGLSEEKARRYFRQILQAIDYCHRLYVVHRDLKPENVIFFKKYDVAKLTDFGFSNKFMPGTKLQTACGSLAYSAPEILLGDSYDAPAVDIWSLGVILYMMVVGKAPFYEANESETLTMILDCNFHIPDHVSPACQSLISQMIVRDACKRATLRDILGDPWVQGDHGPVAVTSIPLANQVKIGLDHHNEIVEKMQLGDIADHDTINKCLESGSYNHISATYYLLAEQILRRLRWHRNVSSSSISSSGQDEEVKSHVLKRQSMPPQKVNTSSSDEEQNLTVPSVEDLPLSDGNAAEEPEDIDMNLVTSKIRYHSTESIYDELKKSDKHHNQEEIVGAVSVAVTTNQRKTFQKKRVAKVKSTPAFLNQISEERESDLDDSPRASPRVRRSSRRPLNVIQKTRRPSPASSTGGRRSSSHSSSSEDDGDLDKKMRRLSTERCRKSPKRRSDDEGDGDDGSGGTQEPHGVARKKMMSEKPQECGSNKETTSKSGGSSDKQGKSTQPGLHSRVLQDKLFNAHIKLAEEKNSSCVRSDNTVMDIATCNETCLPKNLSNFCKDASTISCWENSRNHQDLKVQIMTSGGCEGDMDVSLKKGINAENIIECCQTVQHNSVNNMVKPRVWISYEIKSKGKNQAECMLVGSENISVNSKDCVSNPVNRTNDVQNIVETSERQVQFLEQNFEEISYGNAVESLSAKNNVQNEKCAIDGVGENETVETNLVNDDGSKSEDNILAVNDECSGIMEIFKERSLTNENLEGISDKENIDICEKESRMNGDCKRMRGSDIEEIEMYMKNRETTELQSGAVRTIYNNPKISRVTSNCCHIV